MNLKRLHHSIVLAWGWRRWLIAFGAGAASALAMAPFNIWPVLFATFSVLAWLIDGAGRGWRGMWVAAATGWWFGFGYFLAGLYWVGFAFLVDASTFGWLLPVAVLGLPAWLALYTGLGVALARVFWTRGVTRLLALGIALTATEWLRGHAFTGFPWNTFGYALTAPLVLAQIVSVIGIWGLTLATVVVCASPATLGDDRSETRWPWLPLGFSVMVLAGFAAFGAYRLMHTPAQLVSGIRLRIMQPNLQQDVRFNYAARQEVVDRYVALSGRIAGPPPAANEATLLIWPESSFPFFLTHEPEALAAIVRLLQPNTVLITGAMRVAEPINRADPAVYNSIYVIDHDGSIVSLYDKVHLVPFGEYLPFQHALESLGLQQLTKQRGGFLAGDRHRIIAIPGAPTALPLICYEVIFPGELSFPGEFGVAGQRPGWIINVTNDGWFGISSGPYQHFQQAQVGAIEQGLPLVRAANTGISGVIDPVGRVIAALPLGREGVVDSVLPRPIPVPLYARLGDLPVGVAATLGFIAVLRRRLRRDSAKSRE